jgi:uncharacterized membrane protein
VNPLFLALLAALLFGAATPISKILLQDLGSFQLAGLLYLGAALGVAPVALRPGSGAAGPGGLPRRDDRKNWLRLAGSIVFGGILGPVLLLLALKMSDASSVSLRLNLELAATAALGVLIFHDHLVRRGLAGVVVALLAAGVLSLSTGAPGAGAALLVLLVADRWDHIVRRIGGRACVSYGASVSIGDPSKEVAQFRLHAHQLGLLLVQSFRVDAEPELPGLDLDEFEKLVEHVYSKDQVASLELGEVALPSSGIELFFEVLALVATVVDELEEGVECAVKISGHELLEDVGRKVEALDQVLLIPGGQFLVAWQCVQPGSSSNVRMKNPPVAPLAFVRLELELFGVLSQTLLNELRATR